MPQKDSPNKPLRVTYSSNTHGGLSMPVVTLEASEPASQSAVISEKGGRIEAGT